MRTTRFPLIVAPIIAVVGLTLLFSGDRLLAKDAEEFVVIQAGRIITVVGDEIAGGQIILKDGKIRLVGVDLEYPATAKVIDARHEVVMPGMIVARTRWQLPSYDRTGLHADRSVANEIFLDEVDMGPLLTSGFTAACFYPNGTGIPGLAAVYRTAGAANDRAIGKAYLRVTMSHPGRDKKTFRDAIARAKKEIEKVAKARKEWDAQQKKAKEEATRKTSGKEEAKKKEADKKEETKKEGEKKETEKVADVKIEPVKKEPVKKADEKKPEVFTPPPIDRAVRPLVAWIRDKKGPTLLYELARASDLHHLDNVLALAPELPLRMCAFLSGSDGHQIVTDLGRRGAVVLLTPRIGRLPNTATHYPLAAELVAAGATIVFVPRSDATSSFNQFRSHVADLVRSGLPREEALAGITLEAAKLVGISDRCGTIEKGKEADLIFLDGDPLAPATRVTRAMIDGKIVWEASE